MTCAEGSGHASWWGEGGGADGARRGRFRGLRRLDRILRIHLRLELDEPESHVLLRELVLWNVHVDDGAALHHHLPQQRLIDLAVEVAHVARRLLVAVEARFRRHRARSPAITHPDAGAGVRVRDGVRVPRGRSERRAVLLTPQASSRKVGPHEPS